MRQPGPTPRDIACIELVEMLTDYLEGALPARRGRRGGCAPRDLPAVPDLPRPDAGDHPRPLGSVPVETLSDEAYDTLLAAFRDRSG